MYRGRGTIRDVLAEKLAVFSGAPIDANTGIILTPGTQGALFLAMGANIGRGDKVAIVEPDYFANRKLVEFFDGELVPIQMDYLASKTGSGLDLVNPDNLLTIIGPSKTESLSGFRLGVAYGSARMIERMEKLQAIVSLRAAGYCQAVFADWFSEPEGWMTQRVTSHQAIRDDIHALFSAAGGFRVRLPEGGSYLFPTMPEIDLDILDFTKVLRLQAGVSVTPGIEFGPQFTGSFRINFSQDHEAAVAAIRRTIEIVNRYRV